ncbi:hypothetical protein T11_16575 [Trichinella zimbabwensis]|uniref:Uncharacterized protein n=1 Tax=Trichinella zimbabwensis TaxID=268475 RepID=A0A0V1G8T5_9BILA|nr:hypothetical protein T11_16575 [Trichinella zimbabwensis]
MGASSYLYFKLCINQDIHREGKQTCTYLSAYVW